MDVILAWLENSALGVTLRGDGNWFPWVETFHVLFVTTLVGTISIVDLRLLGWAWTRRPIREVAAEILPISWIAFTGAAITGFTIFTSRAVTYAGLWPFQIKLSLLFLAFLNMAYFHLVTWKTVDGWDREAIPPRNARLAGGLSLGIWILVIVCGRWTGFMAEYYVP